MVDKIFVDLLAWLADKQTSAVDSAIHTAEGRVYDVAMRHPQLLEREIREMGRARHSAQIDGHLPRYCIWLEPTDGQHAALPLLSPHWDFREPAHSLSLYVAIYYLDTLVDEVDGMGYRYEGAHGSGDEGLGEHDFYHAQPIMDFADGGGATLLVQERSQPTSFPAFPLDAVDPVQLLVCLLVSLYGGRYATKLGQSGVEGMASVLRDLRFAHRGTRPVEPVRAPRRSRRAGRS